MFLSILIIIFSSFLKVSIWIFGTITEFWLINVIKFQRNSSSQNKQKFQNDKKKVTDITNVYKFTADISPNPENTALQCKI